jgi:hypothetical protein
LSARGQRRFIEAVTAAVQEAKDLVLPLAMLEHPDEPWSVASLRAMVARRVAAEPLVRDAITLLEDFELPFVVEEERLAGLGVTLADDLLGFEDAMLEFERAFWFDAFAAYEVDPERWPLPEPVVADLCREHGLASASVRATLSGQGFGSFEEAAPHVGADPTCGACRLGITRLLTAELARSRA